MQATTGTTRVRIAGMALLVALLLPAPVMPIGNGIPVADWFEVWSGLACVGLVAFAGRLSPLSRIGRLDLPSATIVLAVLAIAGKALLLLTVSPPGFEACYSIPVADQPTSCARSYDAPLADSFTQRETAIDFRSASDPAAPPALLRDSTWSIGAVNSIALNFWQPDKPDRMRLPIKAEWRGTADRTGDLRVTYVGQGSVLVGGTSTSLPLSTEGMGAATVPVRQGQEYTISYEWAPGADPAAPYAAIVVTDAATGELATSASASGGATVGAWFTVAVMFVALLLSLVPVARLMAKEPAALAVLVLMAGAGWYLHHSALPSWTDVLLAPVAVIVLAAARWWSRRSSVLLAAWLGMPLLALGFASMVLAVRVPAIVYRDGGSDFLTYEGYARTILDGDGLRAGEPIFVYSPGMRYWLFGQHLLFGEASTYIVAAAVLAILLALWFAVEYSLLSRISTHAMCRARARVRRAWAAHPVALVLGGCAALLLAFSLWTYEVTRGGVWLLSEYPTWSLLVLALPIAVFAHRPLVLATGSAALGLALTFRGDQIVGLTAVVLVAAVRIAYEQANRPDRARTLRTSLAVVLPFGVIGLLPALHNVAYGGRFVPFATSLPLPVNFPLPPARLLEWSTDPAVAETFRSQLGGVLGWVPLNPDEILLTPALTVCMRVIQAGLVLLVLLGVVRRFRGAFVGSLLVLVPLAFLVPHLFIQVYVYYPRHIIQGYLAGAVVLLAAAGLHVSRARPASAETVAAASIPDGSRLDTDLATSQ